MEYKISLWLCLLELAVMFLIPASARGACPSVLSAAFTVDLREPPVITQQPQSQTNCVGATVTFTVVTTGSAPLTYQWRLNATNIARATNTPLVLSNVQSTNQGSYTVVVSNAVGSVTSQPAALTVNSATAITSQPVGGSRCPGQSISFSVSASGTAPFSYQWRKGGVNLSGATSSSYTIASVSAGDAGDYDVGVTGTCGNATSSAATLTVNSATAITSQPVGGSRRPGQSITFSVGAGGTGPFSYQWHKGGVNITGATSASYTIVSVSASDGSDYAVVVSGACGDVRSSPATLIVIGQPVIAPISDRVVSEGSTLAFTVSATNSAVPDQALTYSLAVGAPTGAKIDASSGVFTWTPTEEQGPGTYPITVLVIDDGTPPLSATNTFTVIVTEVNSAPTITAIPNQTVKGGTTLTVPIKATDSDLPSNKLTFTLAPGAPAGARVDPATGVFTWTPPAVLESSTNLITVQVTDDGAPSLSATQTFTVVVTTSNSAPLLAPIPDQTVVEGVTLRLVALATDSDTPVQSLTFNLEVGAPSGANIDPVSGVFTWTPTEAQGPSTNRITVRVTDDGMPPLSGSKTFSVVVIEKLVAPAITLQPQNQTRNMGDNTVFAVSAAGSPPLTYQWRFNGVNITGATNASLTISNVQKTNEGGYSVVVSNSAGSDTSQTATLTVIIPNVPPTIISQPQSLTRCVGLDGTFTAAAAAGSEPLTYQWQFNGTDITDATNPTLPLANVQKSNAGNYTVVVRNAAGSVTSQPARLSVNDPVVITVQPASQTVCAGASVTFSVNATGTGTSSENIYVSDTFNYTIRKVTPAGVVTTLAGFARSRGSADGMGSSARFNNPVGVAVDGTGNVYVADNLNHTIRKVSPTGAVTTLAGSAGSQGSEDGIGSGARFSYPTDMTVDSVGNVYVADWGNSTIRKITTAGAVTTLAGVAGSFGSVDGIGRAARFSTPDAVAVDSVGNVYVADFGNDTIRKVTPAGAVTTLAGLAGSPGSADGMGNSARFHWPRGVALDGVENLYVGDSVNYTIRKVSPTGVVTTLAGLAGSQGSEDGSGSGARFVSPGGVAVDSAGNVYVADFGNETIRKVTPAGVVTTLAGLAGQQPGSVDGTGSAARFYGPSGVAVGRTGLSYQWRKGGVAISGATGPSYTIASVSASNLGAYDVVVSGTCNTVTSQAATLTLCVQANGAPSFTKGPDQTVDEDSGLHTVANWASAISPGPANEAAQKLTFQVSNTTTALFSVQPTISPTGTLTFTPVPNAYGVATVTVILKDDGGQANGGVDTSAPQTFTVTIRPVNDTPSFIKGADQVVNEDSGAHTISGWATNISAGPANEAGQVLRFEVTNNNSVLFFAPPAINSTGTLTFTPAPNQSGSATGTVVLKDDGGTANSGTDTSPPQTFTIRINPVNHAPVLASLANKTVAEGSLLSFTVAATDLDLPSQSLTFGFGGNAPAGANINPATGVFSWTPTEAQGPGSHVIAVRVMDNGNPPLSATTNFTVIVNEVNLPPVLAAILDQTVTVGDTLPVQATATDSDLPANQLTFSLEAGAPSGASVDPKSGVFSWTPSVPQAPSTNRITVRVTDNGIPSLSATTNFTVIVQQRPPINTPPTVSIITPVNGATFPAGTNMLIEAIASDPDGSAAKVEFFQGNSKLGDDSTAPYSVIWNNVPAGNYTLTAKATDNQGATGTSGPVTISVVAPAKPGNNPPTVSILSPTDRTIFQDGEPISMEALALDPDTGGRVDRVEFFAGSSKLGEVSTQPYRFLWVGANEGHHVLTARAVDDQGATGESAPVRIVVSKACTQAAIVCNFADPEIAILVEYLYEIGVKAFVFDRSEATREATIDAQLAKFKDFGLVIVDEVGRSGLSDREVNLFAALANPELGKALYYIGDTLVSSAQQLNPAQRTQWFELIHLTAKSGLGVPTRAVIDAAIGHPVGAEGKAGTVQDFNYPFPDQGVEQTHDPNELVLGRAGSSDVLVVFEESTTGASGRRVTQAFRVATGEDDASKAERKKLFQNAVWWLMKCVCNNLDVTILDDGSPTVAKVGEQLTYSVKVTQAGGCEALLVTASSILPPGLEFLEASSNFGLSAHNNGVVTFALGRLTRGAEAILQIRARFRQGGVFTNAWQLRSLNEDDGARQNNHVEIVTQVESPLSIKAGAGGLIEITLRGPPDQTIVVEASADLRTWTPVRTVVLTNGRAVFVDLDSSGSRQRFYRASMGR